MWLRHSEVTFPSDNNSCVSRKRLLQVIVFLQIVCSVFVTFAVMVCLYHMFLAAVALLTRSRTTSSNVPEVHNFAIVIPAHNESGTIEHSLNSCAALNYPKERYTVYVIADNCEDDTAEIAASFGATCLIRRNEQERGKGYALEWAIPQVLDRQHDSLLILDADCQIDAHALRVFDHRLQSGDRVLQANYVVANPDDNSMSYLLALANMLENDLFYAPKSALGLAVFLRGTGMLFHRDVLASHPWQASSVVEDAEYAYRLLREGVRISFVPNVRVVSDFPTQQDQLDVQRKRWIGGNIALGKRHGFRLFRQGLLGCRLPLIDAGWTTMIISRPMVILQLISTLVMTLLCRYLMADTWSTIMLVCCLAAMAFYALYVAIGVGSLGLTAHRVRLLLGSPAIVSRYLLLSLQAFVSSGPTAWNRTPRMQGDERQ